MAEKIIAGVSVQVNDEGYLENPNQWTPEIAKEIAAELNIELTDKHFKVLNYLRTKQEEGVTLSIRSVGKSGVADIKELYRLFPGGPLKYSSKIAGIKKPTSCV